MKYYQMKIEFAVPDDVNIYIVKQKMDQQLPVYNWEIISTIRGSAKTRFDRAKMFAEHKK